MAGVVVDPSLSAVDPVVPSLPRLLKESVESKAVSESGKTILVVEGLPPLPSKLVDAVRQWEFVDFGSLIADTTPKMEDWLMTPEQVVVVPSIDQLKRKKKEITDIVTWCQAFAVYTAVHLSNASTTPDQAGGLMAYQYHIVQMQRDLGANKWLRYDQEFRLWAGAKKLSAWGDLNLSIYGKCIAGGGESSQPTQKSSKEHRPMERKKGSSKHGGAARRTCFKFNFENTCDRKDCTFPHLCYYCGEEHKALSCSLAPKKAKAHD